MKTILLFASICAQFLSFEAFSQVDQIYPFEDYRQCYTGFRNKKGDTIHEAKFTHVHVVRSRPNNVLGYCWIVEEAGRYGVLNEKGEYLLKPEYDTIHPCYEHSNRYLPSNWLIKVKQGRYGLIDLEGKALLPSVYTNIQPYEKWLKVYDSFGKVALLDSSLNPFVPFKYEEISYRQIRDYTTDTILFHSFYTAQQNGLFGLLKEDFTPILPFEFERVWVKGTGNYFKEDQLYIEVTKNDLTGLYGIGGKQIIPLEYEWINLTEIERYDQRDQLPTALSYAEKKYTFWNLSTGEHSESFHQIRPFGGKAIGVHKNGNWTVIDSKGNSIGKGKKDWYPEEETLSTNDSIVMVQANSKRPVEHNSLLFHYGSGRYTSEESGWLMRLSLGDESFCWTSSNNKITIYNSQLEKVNSLDQEFSMVMEELEEEEVPFDLSIQILENQKHLLGGFNARGDEVIPQIYTKARVVLKELPHKRLRYLKTPDYFELSNDTSLAYYTMNGELIRSLNFNQIYPLCEGYYAAKSGTYTSILNANYDVVLDSCSRAFQYNALNSDWSTQFSKTGVNYYPLFAFRNQQLLELVDGKFLPTDSTRYEFKNKLHFQFDALIDRSGSIVSPEGTSVRKIGQCFLAEKADEVTILSLDGGVLLHLDLVDKCQFIGDYLFHCTLRDGRQGIFNAQTAQWSIPLLVQGIVPIKGIQQKAKYSIRRIKTNSNWQLYAGNGNLVSDLALDHAISKMGSTNVVRINGKMGVMSSSLELLIPAEYDYISYFKQALFLRKNNQWIISRSNHTMTSEAYTSISTRFYPKGRLVFQDRLIGVIDQNNEELIAPTDEQTLLSTYDLAKLLYDTKKEQVNQFPIVSKTNEEEARNINNRIILEGSRFETTNNDVMPLGIEHYSDPKYIHTLNDTDRKKSESPSFMSKSYYACRLYSSSQKWGIRDYKRRESTQYYNYGWFNGQLQKINLDALFNSAQYAPHLDSLITDFINEQQTYGISCVNLNDLLMKAKNDFVLTVNGIVFFPGDYGSYRIVIPYEPLRSFLKHPEEFIH